MDRKYNLYGAWNVPRISKMQVCDVFPLLQSNLDKFKQRNQPGHFHQMPISLQFNSSHKCWHFARILFYFSQFWLQTPDSKHSSWKNFGFFLLILWCCSHIMHEPEEGHSNIRLISWPGGGGGGTWYMVAHMHMHEQNKGSFFSQERSK